MSDWCLGTIGFSYKEWVGGFYPTGTSQREYLHYYCKVFNSVELDTTFHSIPRIALVESWYTATPSDFKFCLKTPRTITHDHRLQGMQGLMSEFLEALNPLYEKIGPILIQLPPSLTQDNYLALQEFLESLPQSYRYALEFRHSSWYNEQTTQLLSQHKVCWVSLDFPNLPRQINVTTDFLYIRWIGINGMYHYHSYEREDKTNQLKWWLQSLLPFDNQIPTIYGYFNNDYTGFAAGTCKRFIQLAGLAGDDQNTPFQESMF
jgi:uncharacterized protein YecE (DUF72 family)